MNQHSCHETLCRAYHKSLKREKPSETCSHAVYLEKSVSPMNVSEDLPRSTLVRLTSEAREFSVTVFNNLGCGFLSGCIVTGLLNPYDRALYLSLMNHRSFLDRKNFVNPYQGLSQTLVQRSLSTGLYFPLEDLFMRNISKEISADHRNILAGNFAGIVNGLLLNPLAYIKYQCWGRQNYSFFSQAKKMYRNGGILVFGRGLFATCLRDATFGATYSLLRNFDVSTNFDADTQLGFGRKNKPFVQDLISAGIATVVSSPLNYFRNIQYHRHSAKSCPSMRRILLHLIDEVRQEKTLRSKFDIVQHRFRLGWGTLRVAIGMAMGSKLYSVCHQDPKAY